MKRYYFIIFMLFICLQLFSNQQEDNQKLENLKSSLVANGVPIEWIVENLNSHKFEIYSDIEKLFLNMAENKVKTKQKDFDWYKNHFGLDKKIQMGTKFIEGNIETLQKVEEKNGIYFELAVAILGMETNFGQRRYVGNYYIFNTLVSQYLLLEKREKFALRELIYLYKMCQKTNKNAYYFVGSYAGACGLGQFIPSSLFNYFVDVDGIDENIDIYSLDDNLCSIENYLFKNNLNNSNIDNQKSLFDSVYSYNRSSAYVNAVLYIYEELKKLREKT